MSICNLCQMFKKDVHYEPKMILHFHQPEFILINPKNTNKVKTSRYTLLNWIPKSLIMQFSRAANIYFLIITILTFMPFSPKSPGSMLGTFVAVLIFTMLKEAWEDVARHKQDNELNNKLAFIFDQSSGQFRQKKWQEIKAGELIKVLKDEEFPSDIILLKSDKPSGIVFVDTMNLDGETNLKEKIAPKEVNTLSAQQVEQLSGSITCDSPNEFLDKWDGNITINSSNKDQQEVFNVGLKQLLLRGCTLRNTDYCIGFVLYTGPQSKIMMNAKKPPTKVSNVQRKMNKMLYSVFAFQLLLILFYAILSVTWIKDHSKQHFYLNLSSSPGFGSFIIQYLTYWVAYSHLIPISLYVVLEIIKMGQAKLIAKDVSIYDQETGFSGCRNSDLIEEMGQVEFIFSDKTGTLTCNVMEFKQCSINGEIYQSLSQVKTLLTQDSNQTDIKAVHQFFKMLAICHSVVIDQDKKTGEQVLQASSPDELALVEGAKDVSFKFIEKTSEYIGIQIGYQNNKYEKYSVLAEFPFDSTRKRMSLLVRDQQTNKIMLMTKGADSIMLPRTILNKKTQQIIDQHLHQFACAGLRTLVMAQKYISENEFKQWFQKFLKVSTSNDSDKEIKLNKLYDEMETELEFIGCSAIEDLLQDQVPETIQMLMSAGIRIWVLTGDKQETAIEIGKSCNLINEQQMKLIILSSTSKEQLQSRLNHAQRNYIKGQKMCIVIDGQTLTFVLENDQMAQTFFKFGCLANSVICCRVSPKQKSDVVALAKRNGNWITLSVGDGANDVPMIMEAHIGVGIRGKEGTQAVRSADYAIGKFKFLQQLILAHGRWGYRRIGTFICYYFYKNVLLVFCELYFAFYNGYSGQIYFADWLPMLYNAFFTSWPCIFTFIYERDVDSQLSLRYPALYAAGPKHFYFNFKIFWRWMAQAFFHGFLCLFFPLLGYFGVLNGQGQTAEHWFSSSISFTLCLHLATYKLFLESYYWNIVQSSAALASVIMYYLTCILGSTSGLSEVLQPQITGTYFEIFASYKFWLIIIIVPFVCLIPDITMLLYFRVFSPSPTDKVLYSLKNKSKNYSTPNIYIDIQDTSKGMISPVKDSIDSNRIIQKNFNENMQKLKQVKSQYVSNGINFSQPPMHQQKTEKNYSKKHSHQNSHSKRSRTKKANQKLEDVQKEEDGFSRNLSSVNSPDLLLQKKREEFQSTLDLSSSEANRDHLQSKEYIKAFKTPYIKGLKESHKHPHSETKILDSQKHIKVADEDFDVDEITKELNLQ